MHTDRGRPGGACNAPPTPTSKPSPKMGSTSSSPPKKQLVNGDTDQTNDLYVYDLPTESSPGKLSEVSGARQSGRRGNRDRLPHAG